MVSKQRIKLPTKRAHYIGSSMVVTLDPTHVKRLNIDELTFFVQKPIENGIVLEMRKFDTDNARNEYLQTDSRVEASNQSALLRTRTASESDPNDK